MVSVIFHNYPKSIELMLSIPEIMPVQINHAISKATHIRCRALVHGIKVLQFAHPVVS